MNYNLKNNDIVICTNNTKTKILTELSNNKKILNLKFYNKNEFIKEYFLDYKKEAIYYVMKKYNYVYDVAKKILDNIYLDSSLYADIKKYLEDNNLLTENKLFKKNIKRIVVIGVSNLDLFLKKEIEKYEHVYIEEEVLKNNIPKVYEFNNQRDEVVFIANKILELANVVNLNNIFIVNTDSDYEREIKKVFKQFNIPINLYSKKNIFSTRTVINFLNTLESTRNINSSLENIPDNDIKNKIIDCLNEYVNLKEIDDVYINIIKETLKNTNINYEKIKNAVNEISIDDITNNEGIYFFMGFIQGAYPTVSNSNTLFSDKEKKKLGINTDLDILISNKKQIVNYLYSLKNVIVTYKIKDNYRVFYPNPLIQDLNLEVVKNPLIEYKYSNAYNKLILAEKIDRYINYNEKDDLLVKLLSTYKDIKYAVYDNKYKNIDFDLLSKFLNNKLNLSYSSMNNYYLCAFRFYIENILKLDPFSDNFAAFIGDLFHYCLSKMYNEDFSLEEEYYGYIKDKELSEKEKFFVNKLYNNLEFIIDTIKYQDSFSKFDDVDTEKKISIKKESKLDVNFLGFVDKIKYLNENDKKLAAIIDYKTGYIETNLDNINYGLHLQLPVYIYLIKSFMPNVNISGFYLQKILNNYDLDSSNIEENLRKKLKLDGFTIDKEDIIEKFDSSYESSEVIKSMSTTSKGFSRYAKLVNDSDIDVICNIVSENINNVIKNIENTEFSINPKRIDNELLGCKYCKFKELCYQKEEDIKDLENKKIEDILGKDGVYANLD